MNRKNYKWLTLALLAISSVMASAAEPLQFTNVTLALFPRLTDNLNAVAYGGSSNFLAVGDHQTYVVGNFTPMQSWFTSANWATNRIFSNSSRAGSNLTSVASSGNLFVASGVNNWVFFATNSFSAAGLNWPSNNSRVFANSALAAGAAYNGGRFSIVGEAPEIGWVGSSLVTTVTNWNLANLFNPSFAESFRGITPVGFGGFAACGVFGDVRISADGTNWQTAIHGQIGQPDFYGIAYDGANTLVCVGATNATTSANGVIMVSINGGNTWQVAYPNNGGVNGAGTSINAVAYTGSGFVAVGNNGQVLTSTNGVSWVVIPPANIPAANINSATNLNLNGVTFATGGYMHDIGEIVGANGNVIITAPPPPTNNSLGNKWICVGVTTPVFENTLQVTNAWGTNIVTVDWYDAPVGGTRVATGTFNYTPPFDTDNSRNLTNYYWAQSRDLRTGFVNTNRTQMVLTNFMRPTAAMITTNTICNGDTTTIQAKLAGNGPWTVYWTDGFTFFTNTVGASGVYYASNPYTNTFTIPNAAFNPTNLFLNAATNHNYWVWKLSDSYFPADDPVSLNPTGTNWVDHGDLTGTDLVTVNPRPTVAVVTTNTICNGDPAVLQANLTGLGPWTVYWTDGFTNFTQTVNVNGAGPYTNYLTIPNGVFNPTNVFLNASTNHSYWVVAISDSNCTANASDIIGVGSIKVNPRPTATLVTTNIICNGDATMLPANLTGLGPWTVYWTDGFTNYTQTVNVNAAGPYVDNLAIPNGVFNPTNVFPNSLTNHSYQVYAVSDTNCSANARDIVGTDFVTVYPRPTAIVSGTTNICNGQTATIAAALTGTGPTWTVTWQETWNQGSALIVTNYTSTNVTLVVSPQDQLKNNYTFKIVALTDSSPRPCGAQPGDLTGAAIVTVNPRPTARMLSFNTTDCNEGPVYTLTNTLTGTGPWVVTWNDGSAQIVTNIGTGPAILTRTVYPTNTFAANVSSNNVYYVTNVSDADSCVGSQPGDITGAVTNTVNPRPTAWMLSFNTAGCNEGSVYTLTNTLTGTGPWVVTWNDGLLQTNPGVGAGPSILMRTVNPTNGFAADAASNNVYYVTAVVDADGCVGDQPGDITGVVTNTVNPRPTAALWSFNTTDCNEGSVYTLTNTLTGFGPWVVTWNDGLKQTNTSIGAGPSIWTRTVHPTNSFAANAASNNVYYVVNVMDATGCAGDEPGDITGAVTNTVNPRPTAWMLSFNTTDCNEGSVYTLTNTLTGFGPWVVTWNDGLKQTNTSIGAGPSIWTRTVHPTNSFAANTASNNVYYVTAVMDATSCVGDQPGDIKGVVTNTVNPRPTAALWSFNTADCNEGSVYTLTNTLTGLGPWVVTWNDGLKQTNTSVGAGPSIWTRTVHPTNSLAANAASNNVYYVAAVVDASGCAGDEPGDITGAVTNTVNPRPTAALWSFISTDCNDGVAYTLTNTLTGLGPWVVTWNDGLKQTNTSIGAGPSIWTRTVYPTNSLANAASNNVYYVTAVVEASGCAGDHAGDITGAVTNKVNPRPTATLVTTNIICNSDATMLQANLTGLGPWTVYWTDGFTNYTQTVNVNAAGPYVDNLAIPNGVFNPTNVYLNAPTNHYYWVTSVVDSNCDTSAGDISGTNLITVYPRPTAIVSGTTNICNGQTATIAAALTGTGPTWTVRWQETWNQGSVLIVTNYTSTNVTLTVAPPNLLPNNPTNYTFTIAVLTDSSPRPCGAQPASLTGAAIVTVNPRPTVSLLSLNTTNCDEGLAYTLTNTLTGNGPWTIFWNDGSFQIATNIGHGPAVLKRVVYPTNSFAASTASNYVYYVTNVSDADGCLGNLPGDIKGTNTIVINPRPTAIVTGSTNISVYSTNIVSAIVQANLTGFGPWTLTWLSNGVAVATHFNASSPDTLTVTNHLTYKSVNTATNYTYVTNRTYHPFPLPPSFSTNIVTNIVYSTTKVLSPNTAVYTVTNLLDDGTPDNCAGNLPGDLSGSAVVTLTPNPTAYVYAGGPTNICLGDAAVIQADLAGASPWNATWSDGTVMNYSTNTPVVYIVVPLAPGTYIYSITNLTDALTNAASTNLTGSVTITVYAVPTNSPASLGNQTNCVGTANPPLVVVDTNSVVWYDTNGVIVASNTTSFIPADSAPGTWPYFAAEVSGNGCAGPAIEVDLVLAPCTNAPAIMFNGTNGVIQWFGNLTLQSTTNLAPPVVWQDVFTNGIYGTNTWYWTNGVPPWTNPYNFFRLFTN